jgi:hypothetical protein
MCPHEPSSFTTHTSPTRPEPYAYTLFVGLVQAGVGLHLWNLTKAIDKSNKTCFVYVRLDRLTGKPVRLRISNLSGYDVWVEKIEIIFGRVQFGQVG